MASSVQLSLTPEQASLLLPLLQNIVSVTNRRHNFSNAENLSPNGTSSLDSSCSSSGSSVDCPTSNLELSGTTSRFALEDLLVKKKKNRKSTKAQNFLHVSSSYSYSYIDMRFCMAIYSYLLTCIHVYCSLIFSSYARILQYACS